MRPYVVSPDAEAHIAEIVEYIAAHNGSAAMRMRFAFHAAFRHLAAFPETGYARPELITRPLRCWAVTPYIVLYDPASVPLAIVAVYHGARDLKKILKGLP